MAARAVSARWGEDAGRELVATLQAEDAARERTQAKRAEAATISATREARGEGHELDADQAHEREAATRKTRAERVEARPAKAKRRQASRELARLQRRRVRDNERAEAAAAEAATKALQDHGIRHHFRPLPKLAWFVAYMVGASLDRSLALRALQSIGMPKARQAQVLEAAYHPRAYAPRRDVCTGKREAQQRFEHDGRALGGRQWTEGARDEDHPGAIRVIQCAIFLWLAKTTTRRGGYSYQVRGFGRGVLASLCRCGKDAITGHTRGLPGAVRALEQSGFVQVHQPPAERVQARDRGPSGHAYLHYWFAADLAALQLERFFARVAELARLPLVERLCQDPAEIETLARPRPPPEVTFTEADIPF